MPFPVVTHAARLEDCRSRLRELRSRQVKARDHRDSAKEAVNMNGGPLDTHSEQFRRLERAVEDLREIETNIGLVEQEERYVLSQIAGIDGSGAMTYQENALRDPAVLENLQSMAHSNMPIGNWNLGPVMSRDELIAQMGQGRPMAVSGDVTLPDTARQGPYYGVVPQLRRPLTLLDVIPTAPMDQKSFDFTRESGNFDTAAETVEGATKPQADVTLIDAQVVAKTIAHWTKMKRQQIADVPALATTIESRLVYGVNRRIENQCLAGDGTGENLLGILNTSGIGAPASVTGDNDADMALNGVIAVMQSFAQPDAIVINPVDYSKMLKARATGSGERIDSEGAFGTPPTQMWGLNLVVNTAMAAGTGLIGDFARGCTLFVREGVNARLSDADQDDFTRNRITCLAECRVGFAVWQSTCFAKVTLP
jgi:HK97 family phage major capsid protein